jgi:hypothetical protein
MLHAPVCNPNVISFPFGSDVNRFNNPMESGK